MKIRFQRFVVFIGIVIAFLNCGIIYNIYAEGRNYHCIWLVRKSVLV